MSDNPKLILPNKSLLDGAAKAEHDKLRAEHDELSSDYSAFKSWMETREAAIRTKLNKHDSQIRNIERYEGIAYVDIPEGGSYNIAEIMAMGDVIAEHKQIAIHNTSKHGTVNIYWDAQFITPYPKHDIIIYDLDYQHVTTSCLISSSTGKAHELLFTLTANQLKTFQLINETTTTT